MQENVLQQDGAQMDVRHLLLWRSLTRLRHDSPAFVFSVLGKVCGCDEVHAAYCLVAIEYFGEFAAVQGFVGWYSNVLPSPGAASRMCAGS